MVRQLETAVVNGKKKGSLILNALIMRVQFFKCGKDNLILMAPQ